MLKEPRKARRKYWLGNHWDISLWRAQRYSKQQRNQKRAEPPPLRRCLKGGQKPRRGDTGQSRSRLHPVEEGSSTSGNAEGPARTTATHSFLFLKLLVSDRTKRETWCYKLSLATDHSTNSIAQVGGTVFVLDVHRRDLRWVEHFSSCCLCSTAPRASLFCLPTCPQVGPCRGNYGESRWGGTVEPSFHADFLKAGKSRLLRAEPTLERSVTQCS